MMMILLPMRRAHHHPGDQHTFYDMYLRSITAPWAFFQRLDSSDYVYRVSVMEKRFGPIDKSVHRVNVSEVGYITSKLSYIYIYIYIYTYTYHSNNYLEYQKQASYVYCHHTLDVYLTGNKSICLILTFWNCIILTFWNRKQYVAKDAITGNKSNCIIWPFWNRKQYVAKDAITGNKSNCII